MITALIRQDMALRRLSPWLTITAGVGLSLLAVLTLLLYRSARTGNVPDHPLHFAVTFLVVWLAMSVYLLSSGVRTRSSEFTQGLPVGSQLIWTLHHVAVLLSALPAWALMVGIIILGNRLVVSLGAPNIFPYEHALDLVIYLPAGFSLAVALMQLPSREQRTQPKDRTYVFFWILTVFGTLALTLAFTRLPLAAAATLPVAAIAVVWWSRKRAPLTFLTAPREALAPGRAGLPRQATDEAWSASSRPTRGLSYRWFLFRTIHRSVAKKNILPIVGYPVMLILGIALSGWFASKSPEGALRFDLLIITAYMVLAFFGGLTTNLHRIDALPISRRRLLGILMLPPILAIVLGYGFGLIAFRTGEAPELIHLRAEQCCENDFIFVPAGRCEIAWNGEVPETVAPWGEAHTAWSTPLYRGSRAVIFSHYSNTESSSRRYVAHQISRATETVYTQRIPEEEISSRYLDTDAEGNVVAVHEDLTLIGDYPDLRARSEGPAFPVIMLLVLVPGFLLSALYLRSFHAKATELSRNRTLWAILGVLLLAHLGQYALFATQFMDAWLFAGLFKIGIRKLGEAFPGSTLVTWLACGAVILGSYRVTGRAFERIEVSPNREDS